MSPRCPPSTVHYPQHNSPEEPQLRNNCPSDFAPLCIHRSGGSRPTTVVETRHIQGPPSPGALVAALHPSRQGRALNSPSPSHPYFPLSPLPPGHLPLAGPSYSTERPPAGISKCSLRPVTAAAFLGSQIETHIFGAPRDSAGSGATEEGLISSGRRNLRLPLRF